MSTISSTTQQTKIMKIADKLYFFKWLPRWHKFLCCISKQVGCTFIGVLYICLSYEAFSSTVSSTENIDCHLKGSVEIFVGSVVFIMWCITLVSSALFLYGIIKKRPIYLLLFMYMTMLLIAFNMVQSFLMLFGFYRKYSCPMPFLFGEANFFGAVVILYFLVIVNSHYLSIVEKQNFNVVVQPSSLSSAQPSRVPSVTRATDTKPAKSSWFW